MRDANNVNRAEVEPAIKIRFSAKIHGAKIEKAEAETRAKAEAEI